MLLLNLAGEGAVPNGQTRVSDAFIRPVGEVNREHCRVVE